MVCENESGLFLSFFSCFLLRPGVNLVPTGGFFSYRSYPFLKCSFQKLFHHTDRFCSSLNTKIKKASYYPPSPTSSCLARISNNLSDFSSTDVERELEAEYKDEIIDRLKDFFNDKSFEKKEMVLKCRSDKNVEKVLKHIVGEVFEEQEDGEFKTFLNQTLSHTDEIDPLSCDEFESTKLVENLCDIIKHGAKNDRRRLYEKWVHRKCCETF